MQKCLETQKESLEQWLVTVSSVEDMQKCFDTQKESLKTQSRAELSTSKLFVAIITTKNGHSWSIEFKTCRNVLTHRKKA